MTGGDILSGKALSLAVISNPLAGANRRAMPGVRALLRGHSGYRHLLASTGEEMAGAVSQIIADPPDVLAINAGDGSVAKIVTTLCRQSPESLPLLALVPGGTTNMSAADLGLSGRPDSALSRLIRWCQRPERSALKQRPVLSLGADDGPLRYGFFLGIGALSRAVALSLEKRAAARRPELVPPLLTLSLLISLLRGKQPLGAALAVEIATGNGSGERMEIQTLFATTLQSLVLGLRPFSPSRERMPGASASFDWGAVERGFPSPWRTLPRYLTGRDHPLINEDNGLYRRRTGTLRLRYSGDYMVDGEIYPVASVLRVGATGPLAFVRV